MTPNLQRILLTVILAAAVTYACVAAVNLLNYFGVPAQPLPLGTIQWFDEVGITVDRVDRVAELGKEADAVRAHGEFYIVHARIVAPFGFRPDWHDGDVEVRTFAGTNGTMRDVRFAIDKAAQAVLDRQTHRPGPDHIVIGAERHEDLVFDLPKNVEQPAIVFLPANAPEGLLFSLIVPHFWQPHRFNIRYD